MRFWNFRVEISLGFLLTLGGTHFCCAQKPGIAKPSTTTAFTDQRFETPQATINRLIHAVNNHRWRDEYECYAGSQQARFTYHIMVCTRELSDSPDLSAKLAHVLQRSQFPLVLLERFPSQRLDLSNLSDPDQVQRAIQNQRSKTHLQRELWAREVQPLKIDWAVLIEELQPLFIENYRRHEHEHHPSQSGIVQHLDFHVFDRASNIKIDGNLAKALIFASVRDPLVTSQDETSLGTSSQKRSGISNALDWSFRKMGFWESRVKRAPGEITLVKERLGWKIESVPFR